MNATREVTAEEALLALQLGVPVWFKHSDTYKRLDLLAINRNHLEQWLRGKGPSTWRDVVLYEFFVEADDEVQTHIQK